MSEVDGSEMDIATMAFDEIVPGTIGRVLQLLQDDPLLELFGPFKATDANVRTTKYRSMAYWPFELTDSLLGANITAKSAYELIVHVLVEAREGYL
jgi:hypothetical protein